MPIGQRVVCPYCLKELTAKDFRYECPGCGTPGSLRKINLRKHALPLCKNTKCGYKFASNRICGFCSSLLPTEIRDYDGYLFFAILGITGSGKTNFLTVMLHEMQKNHGKIPMVLSFVNDDTKTLFRENEKCIYSSKELIEATDPGIAPPPQLWRLKDQSSKTGSTAKTYSWTIFDGAGEDAEHIDPIISRYINGSKSLMILIDPLALEGISKQVKQSVLSSSTTASHGEGASADMVNGLADYIRNSGNIAVGKKIDRDVAVIFTKIDAVKDTFGSATVMKPSPHTEQGRFVEQDSLAVDAEIRSWLEDNGELPFLEAIESNFNSKRTRFFGVSSFGHPPDENGNLGIVVPHRILDPLLWVLSKEGIISVIK